MALVALIYAACLFAWGCVMRADSAQIDLFGAWRDS